MAGLVEKFCDAEEAHDLAEMQRLAADPALWEEVDKSSTVLAAGEVSKTYKANIDKAGAERKPVTYTKDVHDTFMEHIKSTLARAMRLEGWVTMGGAIRAERLKALEARIEELEKQPFAYDGPHESGKTYDKGTFVTFSGSLWHANYKTASRPGDSQAWTLAVKRGKDGRDSR